MMLAVRARYGPRVPRPTAPSTAAARTGAPTRAPGPRSAAPTSSGWRKWEPTPSGPWHELELARRLPRRATPTCAAPPGSGEAMPFAVCSRRTAANGSSARSPSATSCGGRSAPAYAGYWVDSRDAGQGIIPTALALVVDHAFGAGGLHRIEVNIRPENQASRRVVEKLGFREEAYHPRYLHIDGAWRDHLGYAMTTEDVSAEGGLLARWHRLRADVRVSLPPVVPRARSPPRLTWSVTLRDPYCLRRSYHVVTSTDLDDSRARRDRRREV